jgi:hypothetical protein
MLHSRTQDVDDYVLIGRNDSGQPINLFVGRRTQARKLLQNSGFRRLQGRGQLRRLTTSSHHPPSQGLREQSRGLFFCLK